MTIELKSEHLWPLVEEFTADAPRPPDTDEEGNVIDSFGVPDWVARAMLDDIRQLQARIAELEAEWEPLPDDVYNTDGPEVIFVKDQLLSIVGETYVYLPDDMRLCRRKPSSEAQP
jgi:hypothetical protein